MEKQEWTLEEARVDLEKWVERLEKWQEIPKEEQFIYFYRLPRISNPFVEMANSLIEGAEMTKEEERWKKVVYQLVRFRRAFEALWKAKEEESIELSRSNALEEVKKLLEVYDNYMAGE